MNAHASDPIGETARLWAIRVRNSSFDDWDAFTGWLESDPGHLAAYKSALADEAWAGDLFTAGTPPPGKVASPRPRRTWYATAGAVAAAIAVAGAWTLLDADAPPQEIATAPGEHRTIALGDGSHMVLNGGTRVRYDPDEPRHVELAQGEALFEVRHDERDPFVVMAGGTRLVDAGTVFNVVRQGEALDVAVAEGEVIYAPGADEIRLGAGDALSRPDAKAKPVVGKASPQAVGAWQKGVLQYDDPPLDQVARDLSRNIGRPVRSTAGAARIRFNGTLVLRGTPEEVMARVGPALGVRVARDREGWTMTPTDGARR